MKIGNKKYSPIYTCDNFDEIEASFPFYITRDDDDINLNNPISGYNFSRSKGRARICSVHHPETKAVHFFTNIGILVLNIGERLEFFDIE